MKRFQLFIVCLLLLTAVFARATATDRSAELFQAVKDYDPVVVQVLLMQGADPSGKDETGRSALMMSVTPSIMWVLKGKSGSGKAPTDVIFTKEAKTQEALLQVVKLLLDSGAEVNAQDKGGCTALAYAASNGLTKAVELLLDRGAEINMKDNDGRTALMMASSRGFTEVVRLLLQKGAAVNAQGKNGTTALMRALACRDLERLPGLSGAWLKKSKEEIEADKQYQMQVVKLLLEKGAEVNVKKKDGTTVLIAASHCGFTELVKHLLEKGVEVNAKNNDGDTALMMAAEKGYPEVVGLLLQKGAAINAKNKNGTTALKAAKKEGYADVVRLLKKAGAK